MVHGLTKFRLFTPCQPGRKICFLWCIGKSSDSKWLFSSCPRPQNPRVRLYTPVFQTSGRLKIPHFDITLEEYVLIIRQFLNNTIPSLVKDLDVRYR